MDFSVEILTDNKVNAKGAAMIEAMRKSAKAIGLPVVVNSNYSGKSSILLMYGVGHPIRKFAFDAHVAKGLPAIGFDLGYFGRSVKAGGYPMRLTINAPHPQKLIVDMPEGRWDSQGIELGNSFDSAGHIVICGLGRKGRHQFCLNSLQWELDALRKVSTAYPGVKVVYRPKGGAKEFLGGNIVSDPDSPIENVIRGARMVVVRHSNVAVDACIAGVPVVCEDGAASALYGSDICNPKNPTPSERLRFLRNLAWWQWRPSESAECWKHILSVLTSAPETSEYQGTSQ